MNALPGIVELRGRGLMIGIELPPDKADVRQRLLYERRIFTGEAKPNVIRLLPSLALSLDEADHFLENFKQILET